MSETLGGRISELLEKTGMTQKGLAKVVGVNEVSMSRYISGDRVPKGPVIANIALALNTTADYLLGGKSDEDSEPVNCAASDSVNHPSHYTQGGIECIDAIQASMTPEEFCGYLKGNIMKYLWRYQDKGGVEDLRKARWYLDRMIEEVEK